MRHITIKDIARELALSVSTVSRALADDKNIRRETKERVLAVAKRLGYKRNPVATNLKLGHSSTVGVIVPEMVTPFAAQVIEGIQHVLTPRQIKVILADSTEQPEKERENLAMMDDFMVDGLIVGLCSYLENRDVYGQLLQAGLPIVFYDRIPHGWDVSQVVVDDYLKAFFLTERILRSGRKHIVHIAGPAHIYNSIERERGYRDAMQKYGQADHIAVVQSQGMDFTHGAALAEELVAAGQPLDALFAFTDTLAIGAMNRLRELGVRVPQDVGVAGFSGTDISEIVHPRLTTVASPLFEMGCQAARLLLERINQPGIATRSIVLDAEIRMRESI